MSNPWGKVGSWADDSEAAAATAATAVAVPAALPEEAFPTLGEAKKTGKKKKPQTLSVFEFNSGKYVGPGGKRSGTFSDKEGLTSDELLMLPTGPKERTEEEIREAGGRLGGGFRDYGRDREGGQRERRGDRDRERERGGFGFDREDSSRADESSDWSSNKPARGERHGERRYGGGFDEDRRFGGDRDAPSKADEVDNWNAGKKVVSSERRDDFGRGFGKADADDNWGAGKRPVASERWSFKRSDEGPGPEGERWGRRSDDPPADDKWSSARKERPRLNLQPRSVPVDSSTLPSSNHSSRPGTPEEPAETKPVETKPRKKVDPFGNAKPREVLLQERGQDWRKMDMMLESKRAEHEDERKLRTEISSLKELLDNTGEPAIKEQIAEKEQELEELSKELDSKAKVSDSWRKDPPPTKEEPVKKPAPAEKEKKPATEENAWKKGGNPWKKENGRDRAKVDRW